jgi:glycosyltransferase involved in cell wall biosynthesis
LDLTQGIQLIECTRPIGLQDSNRIHENLLALGVRAPLLWVYDPVNYLNLISKFPRAFVVLHATENYLETGEGMDVMFSQSKAELQKLKDFFPRVDLLIAVSKGVAAAYRKSGYKGRIITVTNGCDYDFWQGGEEVFPVDKRAIYQGGVNERLDYNLLTSLASSMPDWTFVFAGKHAVTKQTAAFTLLGNVQLLGELSLDELRRELKSATVGIIPFRNYPVLSGSFPLKTFEYIASGLPVVSTPINDLEDFALSKTVIQFSKTAEDFAEKIQQMSLTRTDPNALEQRRALARKFSYDEKFSEAVSAIEEVVSESLLEYKKRVAVLFDSESMHVFAIAEHLKSFGRYSTHSIEYIPCTGPKGGGPGGKPYRTVLDEFDAVIVHFSVRVCYPGHMSEEFDLALYRFSGPKILFIQDDYDNTFEAINFVNRNSIDVIYSIVPEEGLRLVYPESLVPRARVFSTLTGFAPKIPKYLSPLENVGARKIDVGYRGRELPSSYGQFAVWKQQLGSRFAENTRDSGLRLDVSSRTEDRVYGLAWLEFLSTCNAILGSPSASNQWPTAPWISGNNGMDGDLDFSMDMISPKMFEATAMGTALVLLEGNYSGVLEAGEHYFSLKEDFSNIDLAVKFLKNQKEVESMVRRAQKHLLESQEFQYASLVRKVDAVIDELKQGVKPAHLARSTLYASRSRFFLRHVPGYYSSPTVEGAYLLKGNGVMRRILELASAAIRRAIMREPR